MPSYSVTASTSVVLVDTSALGAGESAIVLLSSMLPPGRNVSIRDSLGYLSSPQSIIVSTTNGILFTDGTSSISVSQPFVSLTVSSRDGATWNLVNTFGFPSYDTVANVRSLAASTLTGATLALGGSISTTEVFARSLTLQSTAQVLGPTFVSSLVVGALTAPPAGFNTYIQGSALISSNVVINGNLTVGGTTQIGSTVAIAGGLVVANTLTAGGDITLSGNFNTVGTGAINCQTLQSQSSLNIVGPVNVNSNVIIQSNLTVGATLTAATLNTSTVTINTALGGFMQLGTASGPILQTRSDVLPGTTVASWNAPLYTPFLSTGVLQASGVVTTDTLQVLTAISAPTVTQFLLGSTIIQNTNGSLITSSITANTLTLSSALTTGSLQVSSLFASTAVIQGNILGTNAGATLSTAILNISSIATNAISTGAIVAGLIQTPAVQVSSLTIYNTFTAGPAFTTLNVPLATIDNSRGTLLTSSIFTDTLQTSSFAIASGVITAANTLTITATNTLINNLTVSSFTTSSMRVSTLQGAALTIGSAPTATNPNFIYSSTPSPSTNVVVTGGPGDYLTPFFLSNVIPAGQNPAVPYTTTISFNANYNSAPLPPGLLIGYNATLFWGGETASILSIAPGTGPTLYGLYSQDQTVSGTLPLSTFQITASLYGASAISVNFAFQYSTTPNLIDSNAFIEFNNGVLNWKYALNGTTIQNSLNDISTRNLYYYGSLNFASDPRVKEDIQDANLELCYETIRSVPLRKFKYIDSYCSTFQVRDTHRLGFLANELQEVFPKSVHASDTVFPEFSTSLLTIDTAQIDMAHIGATKYLIQQVSSLEGELREIKAYL